MKQSLHRLFNLRPGEGGRTLLLCLVVFTGHAVQSVGKILQLSVFLDHYGRQVIPYAFLVSAVSVALVSTAFAALARLVGRDRLAPLTIAVLLCGFLIWRLVVAGRCPHSAFILYIWVEVASVLAVVLAWNGVNNACDPRQGKRILPLAGLGASMAFLLGGFGVHPLIKLGLRAEDLSFFVMAALAAGVFLHQALARANREHDPEPRGERRAKKATKQSPRPRATGGRGIVEALRSGFGQIAASKLLTMFAVVTVLAILAQQLLDYMFLSTLKHHYDKTELAAFLGIFMGALGAVQIVLQLLVTGRLLSRLGGALCVLIAPAIMAVGALLYFLFPGFILLVGLRFTDRIVKTSFYSPSLQALYTPVARERKIQAMALIKGLVAPMSKAVGAFGLIALAQGLSLRWVALGVLGVSLYAVVYLALRAKKAYLRALEKALKRRKLSLDGEVDEEFGLAVDGTVLELVRKAVRQGPEGNAVFALQFLAGVPLSQARGVILEALDSVFPQVRGEAVDLLEDGGAAAAPHIARRGLSDEHEDVVLRSLGALARLEYTQARPDIGALLEDERAKVRAGAAIWMHRFAPRNGDQAGVILARMIADQEAAVRKSVTQALSELGQAEFVGQCKVLLYDKDAAVRAEALRTAGKLGLTALLDDVFVCFVERGPRDDAAAALARLGASAVPLLDELAHDADAAETIVRRIPWILADITGKRADVLLVKLLTHSLHEVRLRAAKTLAARPTAVVADDRLWEVFHQELVVGYRYLGLKHTLLAQAIEAPLLAGELDHRQEQIRQRTLALLGLVVDPKLVDMVAANLKSGVKRLQASAVELTENVAPVELALPYVLLLEELPEASALQRIDARFADAYRSAKRDPEDTIRQDRDRYLKAFWVAEVRAGKTQAPLGMSEEVQTVLPLIEKILFLKSAPIFSGLAGDELHRIAEIADEISFDEGAAVVQKNDPGDAMYLVMHGAVSIQLDGREVARLGPKECFGEMALLDNLPRSADAVAVVDTDLLRIDAESFDQLLEQKHAIVKGILRVLTGRLRAATARRRSEGSMAADGVGQKNV
jgi:ATP/ADP translocase/HEAT repeat protein